MESIEAKYHILIVDDDKKLCTLITDYLTGYGIDCLCVHDGESGLKQALAGNFDAILLDIMLPELDGIGVLRQIREKSNTPVIIISAQTDVSDRVVGLEMGADDYVPKVFSPRELLARIRAVLRRIDSSTAESSATDNDDDKVSIRGLVMDKNYFEATLNGRQLNLGTMEFRLLFLMASHPGRVYTRENLLDGVAGRLYDGFERSIDVHISSLRRKLGDSPHSPAWIRTVRGNGYLFVK